MAHYAFSTPAEAAELLGLTAAQFAVRCRTRGFPAVYAYTVPEDVRLWWRADIRDYGRREGLIPPQGERPTELECWDNFWRIILRSLDDLAIEYGWYPCETCGAEVIRREPIFCSMCVWAESLRGKPRDQWSDVERDNLMGYASDVSARIGRT